MNPSNPAERAVLVRLAGLDETFASHPEDVADAAAKAAAITAQLAAGDDPSFEPWPALRLEARP